MRCTDYSLFNRNNCHGEANQIVIARSPVATEAISTPYNGIASSSACDGLLAMTDRE